MPTSQTKTELSPSEAGGGDVRNEGNDDGAIVDDGSNERNCSEDSGWETEIFPVIHNSTEDGVAAFDRLLCLRQRDEGVSSATDTSAATKATVARRPLASDEAEGERNRLVLLDNVFTEEECDRLISRSEKYGFVQSTVYNSDLDRNVVRKDIRDNHRVLEVFPRLATLLWEAIEPHLPPVQSDDGTPIGFFPLFRYYRYHFGQNFAPHVDHGVNGNDLEQFPEIADSTSKYTCLIYLNGKGAANEAEARASGDVQPCAEETQKETEEGKMERGGHHANDESTVGPSAANMAGDLVGGETDFPEVGVLVTPLKGQVLLFRHDTKHEGCMVKAGLKYVIRTDLLFR